MSPVSTNIACSASRLAGRLATLLVTVSLVGVVLHGSVATGAPADTHQPQTDTVTFRAAQPAPGLIVSIDEFNVLMNTTVYPRELLDWIAFNGPEHTPAPAPELNRVDVVQLSTGGQLLGRLVSVNRDELAIDTGRLQTVAFPQVAAILFCDAPCLVAPGVPVDPIVIATESARMSTARVNVAAPAAAFPVATNIVIEDPFVALRGLVQAPPPTATLPTLAPTIAPIPTVAAPFPIPLVITGTPSATATSAAPSP
ncbi:MAG: hypothetical protein ACKVVP_06820 [Chloroflexota bacterium]